MSSSAAFLRPRLKHPNLDVRIESTATKLLFEGRRVVGVGYRHGAGSATGMVRARRDVIVSCGTINTARLLQNSGIGVAAWLEDMRHWFFLRRRRRCLRNWQDREVPQPERLSAPR